MSIRIINNALILLGFSATSDLNDDRIEVVQVKARLHDSIQYIANLLEFHINKKLIDLPRVANPGILGSLSSEVFSSL